MRSRFSSLLKMRVLGGRASPRVELDAISGSPGVSPSRVFIGRGELKEYMRHCYEKVQTMRAQLNPKEFGLGMRKWVEDQ